MVSPIWLVGTVLALQVPPPPSTSSPSKGLRAESRAILGRERAELEALAGRLKARGQGDAAAEVLARADPPPLPDGSFRFVPLPAVIPAPAGLPVVAKAAPPWHSELRTIRTTTAKALFDLATRAVSEGSKQYTLADECLRAVLGRQPDHAEARRLLGYVPHEGGWATPYAVRELGKGKVLHPTFGWVWASWVPHLDQGELPAPIATGQKVRWLPADQADALRSQWGRGWEISTEHFMIETNVPLSEVIAFGRQLEGFHDLFYALLADVIGDSSSLARRFQAQTPVEERPVQPHLVFYFATRDEYLDHVLRRHGPSYKETLGAYIPPKAGKGKRAPAYFFRDVEGQLAASATLYHEVSHQLLFESGAPNAYQKNVGNYWVFEGMGTYFETVTEAPDRSLQFGGPVGPRIHEARKRLVDEGDIIPLAHLVRLDMNGLYRDEVKYLQYAEAMALTVFLMNARGGEYRDAFLEYFKDACRGRLRLHTGRSLESRLGVSYATLEAQLLNYLKTTAPRPRPR